MSQALFERATNGRHQARSAGTRPAEHVHPVVVDVMRERGIDLSLRRPQKLTDDLGQWEVRAIRNDINARVRQLASDLDGGSLAVSRGSVS